MTFCWKRFRLRKAKKSHLCEKAFENNKMMKKFYSRAFSNSSSDVLVKFKSFFLVFRFVKSWEIVNEFHIVKDKLLNFCNALMEVNCLLISRMLSSYIVHDFITPSIHFLTLFSLRVSTETSIKQFPRLFAMLIFVWVNVTPVDVVMFW